VYAEPSLKHAFFETMILLGRWPNPTRLSGGVCPRPVHLKLLPIIHGFDNVRMKRTQKCGFFILTDLIIITITVIVIIIK
jgi:hypothetical protein